MDARDSTYYATATQPERLPAWLERSDAARNAISKIATRLTEMHSDERQQIKEAMKRGDTSAALSHAERAEAFYEASREAHSFILRSQWL
jgi:hypothetical protein